MAKTWWVLLGLVAFGAAIDAGGRQAELLGGEQLPSADVVGSLRARGDVGLEDLLRTYDALQQRRGELDAKLARLHDKGYDGNKDSILATEKDLAKLDRRIEQWQKAIDEVGGQRGCAVSRLYWYTDLNEAKAAAERTGRPILSLRMLGKLTDEFSCANSRFFRTALYSNQEISDYLRDHFILHWQSVRPVPRVTIDFGDGRKLERTLTGNSAHYILSSSGRPLDVLPGLYGPQQFLTWLQNVSELHSNYIAASESDRNSVLQRYHASRRDATLKRWDADLRQLGSERTARIWSRIDDLIATAILSGQAVPDSRPAPTAKAAGKRAATKYDAEAPLLRFTNYGGQWLGNAMDDELWQAIANLHRPEVNLDEASVAVMRKEFPAAVAMRVSVSKMQQEDPVLRMVRTFESSMAVDTVRNEYLLHRQVHEQFADGGPMTADVDQLNEWVYAELFLTPSSDPWLGLAPNDVYTALENDGRLEPSAEAANESGG